VPPGAAVATAGAYVVVDGRLPFMVGPSGAGDRLGVARLGGHREPGETPWACAAREVREEASLAARPLPPPATYWSAPPHDPAALTAAPWAGDPDGQGGPGGPADPVSPLLVAWREDGDGRRYSLTYLAVADGPARPAAEAAGLLLLGRADVLTLVRAPLTLGAFLAAGGRAVLRTALPTDLVLEPLLQLRVLAVLLTREPSFLPLLR
jgi:8-oxo-dGTP pyrophosphatase MutT (NUDIX family)